MLCILCYILCYVLYIMLRIHVFWCMYITPSPNNARHQFFLFFIGNSCLSCIMPSHNIARHQFFFIFIGNSRLSCIMPSHDIMPSPKSPTQIFKKKSMYFHPTLIPLVVMPPPNILKKWKIKKCWSSFFSLASYICHHAIPQHCPSIARHLYVL